MNIYFFPKKSKRNTYTLYVKIIIDNVTSEVSSGLKVDPETWDHDNDIMEYTHNVRKRLIQVHNTLVKENAIITSQRVKDAYLTKYVDVHTLVGEVKQLIERNRVEVKIGNRSKDTVLKPTVIPSTSH